MINLKAFNPNPVSPLVTKVKKFLDAASTDVLYTSRELAPQVGTTYQTVKSHLHSELPEYHKFWRGKIYWGSPKAIATFKKEIGNE